jgi:GGDEF domain-containing protein
VDFYGDTLFSTRAMVSSQPDWVDAFRAASLRGWEYAMSHQEEIAGLIHAKYAPDLPVDKLRFEAERMVPLVRSDLVELGHTHVGRWQHIYDVYRELGLVPTGTAPDIRGLVYQPPTPRDWAWLWWVLAAAALSLAVVIWIARRFYRLSSRLRQQLDENRRLQDELRALTITDPLTTLHNRRHFDVVCAAEWERARRDKRPARRAVHRRRPLQGLQRLPRASCRRRVPCRGGRRHSRIAAAARRRRCRYGGDEFVVLLPDTDTDGALDVARRVLAAISALDIRHDDLAAAHVTPSIGVTHAQVTPSIGVAQLVPGAGDTSQELLERADRALYAAKSAGRGRIMAAPA